MTDSGFTPPLLSAASFWQPETLVDSAWLEHGAFAFWLTGVLRPARIVELGSHRGFSYFCFCQAVLQAGLDTACFAVDTWQGDVHAGFYGDEVYEEVARRNAPYAAFSHLIRASFDEARAQFADGGIDLLHVDGRHFYDDVRHDFLSWQPKLSASALVLFHDTNVREREFGVWRLFAELRAQYPSFEFLHGHGLGVIAMGAVPEAVAPLFAPDPAFVASERLAYQSLGAAIARRHQLAKAEAAIVRMQNEMGAHIQNVEADRDTAWRLVAEREAALAAGQMQIAALTDQVSALRQKEAEQALLLQAARQSWLPGRLQTLTATAPARPRGLTFGAGKPDA